MRLQGESIAKIQRGRTDHINTDVDEVPAGKTILIAEGNGVSPEVVINGEGNIFRVYSGKSSTYLGFQLVTYA